MSDPAATLRGLADACETCDHLAGNFRGSVTECFHEQRQRLADALPGVGWDGATKDLRAMADEVDRLRAEVARLRRVLAVEQGDESAAPPGWWRRHPGHWSGGSAKHAVKGTDGWFWGPDDPKKTALEAMEAADLAAKEVSDV